MKIQRCPHCKSSNITLDTAGHTGKYLCKDCGYVGVLILEEERE